jgi:hypothetical protein
MLHPKTFMLLSLFFLLAVGWLVAHGLAVTFLTPSRVLGDVIGGWIGDLWLFFCLAVISVLLQRCNALFFKQDRLRREIALIDADLDAVASTPPTPQPLPAAGRLPVPSPEKSF